MATQRIRTRDFKRHEKALDAMTPGQRFYAERMAPMKNDVIDRYMRKTGQRVTIPSSKLYREKYAEVFGHE